MVALALVRLNHELAIWRRQWRTPIMWWRDDDCREPTWRLERLLSVREGLPLTLAVIPDGNLTTLAMRLHSVSGITIAQHGVDHENRLPEGGPRSEFPFDTPQEAENAAVISGRNRLIAAGSPPRFFVPPWNEIDHRLIAAIKAAEYATYSIGMRGAPRDGLQHVGAQIDILRWKGTPRFRGHRRIFDALRIQLEQRRLSGRFDEPIGLLTHHLVHDEAAWKFLSWFVGFSRKRFDWRSADTLVEATTASVTDIFKHRTLTTA